MADALRKEPGIEVEMIDGNRGELTVLVDGQAVASKQGHDFPATEQIVSAVRKAEMAVARK